MLTAISLIDECVEWCCYWNFFNWCATFSFLKVKQFHSWDDSDLDAVTYRKSQILLIWQPQWDSWCVVFFFAHIWICHFPTYSEAPRLLWCPNHGCHSPQGHLSQPRHPHWKCGQWPQCCLSQYGRSVFLPLTVCFLFNGFKTAGGIQREKFKTVV